MIKIKEGFKGERFATLPEGILQEYSRNPLVRNLYIRKMGFFPHVKYHYVQKEKGCDYGMLIYCTGGKGWYKIEEKTYEIKENQYIIIPPNVPYSFGADDSDPWTIYWIHFKGILAPYYAKGASHPMDIQPERHSRISNRMNVFEEIFNTLRSGYSNENLRYVSSLFHYYLGSLRYIQQYRKANADATDDGDMTRTAIHFMKENMEKHITLQNMADHVGYSPSHFSMLFKKQTGHAPLAYFNLLKIQQACFMLDSTDMKVNQICYKVGIEDAYYFSRLFSKIMGMSPGEYRKTKKG